MTDPNNRPADCLGLSTDDFTRGPLVGKQVRWVAWDSPAQDLQIADVIVAVEAGGTKLVGDEIPRLGYPPAASSAFWSGLGEESIGALRFRVRRGEESLLIDINPVVESFYHNSEGQRVLFPDGPNRLGRSGFSEGWSSWYERIIKIWSDVLCDGWRRRVFVTRELLRDHLRERARIDFLQEQHPGAFTEHISAVWEVVKLNLEGRLWPDDSIDLGYREFAEQRADRFKAAADAAHAAYREQSAEQLSDAFPAPDPYEAEAGSVEAKLVLIERVSPRNMRSDGVQAWYILGDRHKGYYFLDVYSPEVVRMWEGILAYQRQVSQSLAESYDFYLKVREEPMMRSRERRDVAVGFKTQLVAAYIGRALFLSDLDTEALVMPGSETLNNEAVALPADDAPVEEFARARIEAIKLVRRDVWQSLWADWTVSVDLASNPIFLPYRLGRSGDQSGWDQSRKRLFRDVVDIKVVGASEPRTVLEARPEAMVPRVDECEVLVEHVGEFDGERRSFKDAHLNRVWRFQRRDGGPWRVVFPRGL